MEAIKAGYLENKLILVDGHNYLFRSFYGIPETARTKSGLQVNAVYGFFAELRKLDAAYPDSALFVVFDSETGIESKIEDSPEYKEGRVVDTGMFEQLPVIKNLLEFIGIPYLEHPEYEADDVIASIATQNGQGSIISSNDFDFIQLVSDKIDLIRTVRGSFVHCDESYVLSRFGISPDKYVDYLALVGDKTDNIKGINGIGPKTAAKLLSGEEEKLMERLSPDERGRFEKNRAFIRMRRDIELHDIFNRTKKHDRVMLQRKTNDNLTAIGIK